MNMSFVSRVSDYLKFSCLVFITLLFGCSSLLPDSSADWDATQTAGLKALQHREYVEAKRLITKAVRQAETFGPNDPRLGRSLMNQGLLYFYEKRYEEAEAVWKRSSQIFEESLGRDHSDFAASLSNLGLVYLRTDRPAKAEPLFLNALRIDERALGPDHKELSTELNNIGAAWLLQRKYQEEGALKRALILRENAVGPNHPSLAGILDNYARLLKETNRGVEASEIESRANAIRGTYSTDFRPELDLSSRYRKVSVDCAALQMVQPSRC